MSNQKPFFPFLHILPSKYVSSNGTNELTIVAAIIAHGIASAGISDAKTISERAVEAARIICEETSKEHS